MLVLAIPILIIVIFFGLFVKLDSEWSMFYTQERVSRNGKVFKIYKLRSMYINAEANGQIQS